MPTVYKVLGQSNPAATTLTTLYTTPAATSTIISTLTAANLSASAITIRIAIRPLGAAISNAHYLVFDASLGPNTTQTMTLGLTLAATDVVSVYASTNQASFHAYGSEMS
jgi:hypothetical protein